MSLPGVRTLILDEAGSYAGYGIPARMMTADCVHTIPRSARLSAFPQPVDGAIAQLVKDFTRPPVRLSFGAALKPSENVRLQAFEVAEGEKSDALFSLLTNEKGRCLVFSRTKRGTERIAKNLNGRGINAAMIHGDRSQSQRTAALTGFQRGQYRVLVATDVAARGIHVQDIAHVINYDLPDEAENFVHRVGRTGRAGELGVASTLFVREQRTELFELERKLGIRITRISANGRSSGKAERPAPSQTERISPNPNPNAGSKMVRLPGEFLQAQMALREPLPSGARKGSSRAPR